MPDRKFFGRKDIWIVLAVVGIGAGLLCWNLLSREPASDVTAVVEIDGRQALTLSLSEDKTITCPGVEQVQLEVKDGKIAFIHSDCPDQVCVHTGWLGEAGQYAACLPNRVAVHLKSAGGDSGPDAIAD